MHLRFFHKLRFWLLTALLVGIASSASAQSPTDEQLFLPLIGQSGTENVQPVQDSATITVEGVVEQVVSEHPEGQSIISRATVKITEVVEGTINSDRLVIQYYGGRVGTKVLYVSHEPVLAEGMIIRATLHTAENGKEYVIRDVDTDLAILDPGIEPDYVRNPQRWHDTALPVLFAINPNTNDVTGDEERLAIVSAMEDWNQVACSYFAFGGGSTSSCNANQSDGVNCAVWQNGAMGEGRTNVFAVTHWFADSSNNYTDVDIVFFEQALGSDGKLYNINWTTNVKSSTADVKSFALHELGHALGLSHENDVTSVMRSKVPIGIPLSQDDINGVCAHYPLEPKALSTSYVNSTAAAGGNCTQGKPCRTIGHGVKRVVDNGNVIIQAGTYRELITLDRPVTLSSTGGTVTINPSIP